MKVRTAILVIGLAATLISIGWAQNVRDRDGNKDWICRDISTIYAPIGQYHVYNIAAAQVAGEPHGAPHDPPNPAVHRPICIDALNADEIFWAWPGAQHIRVTFVPKTLNGTCRPPNQPFPNTPADSGLSFILGSGLANDVVSGCVYDVKFHSSLGDYDPHIIINGSFNDSPEQLEKDLAQVTKKWEALGAIKTKLEIMTGKKQKK